MCGGHGLKVNKPTHTITNEHSLETITGNPKAPTNNNIKWPTPPDAEILQLLSQLDRNKKFALQMSNQ
jgi:hypothetical protein